MERYHVQMPMQRCKDAKMQNWLSFGELIILELHLGETLNHSEKFKKNAKQFSLIAIH